MMFFSCSLSRRRRAASARRASKLTRNATPINPHSQRIRESLKRRPCNELGLSARSLPAACPHLHAPGAPRPRCLTMGPLREENSGMRWHRQSRSGERNRQRVGSHDRARSRPGLSVSGCRDGAAVHRGLRHYNELHAHKALGYRSLSEFIAACGTP
jgi:hypothetical protein